MHKILILGGGFGGVRCALDLEKNLGEHAQITLVDKNSYHLFLPALYEVASIYGMDSPSLQNGTNRDPFAVKMRKMVCIPYGEIFAGHRRWRGPAKCGDKNINFVQAEISAVDLKTKSVATRGGESLPYDYLVISLGSQTADFGIPGVKEYAYQFKSIEDAIAINIKIGKLIKKIASGEKMDSLKIIIAGAGFTGIEFAAEISCSIKKMCRDSGIKGKYTTITLVEAGPKILPMASDKERSVISRRLTKLGVVLMENSPIEEAGADFVRFKNGQTLEGDMVVWTAGIKANEFLKLITDLPLTDKGKIIVDENLLVQGWKNVFAAGDNQEFFDSKTQKPIPALAYTAVDQGKIIAKNIYNTLNNRNFKSYKPFYSVWIAPVGGKFALAHLGKGIGIGGFVGWLIRELVDFRYLASILSFKKAVMLFWQEITMFTKND